MRVHRLFISHPWRRTAEYDALVSLLDKAPGFRWVNHSAPRIDPAIDPESEAGRRALIESLRRQIDPVECMVIIAGMYARHEEWVETEMRIAKQLNKHMVGVREWGARWVPPEVARAVEEIAFWNTPSITTAIARWSW